jgi:hypothetical protein
MKIMNPGKKQSAVEKLLYDKAQLEALIKEREKNLGRDFAYICNNASSLIISGFTSLLFPSGRAKKPALSPTENVKKDAPDRPFALPGGMAIAKSLVPLVWEIARPFILTWGINRMKRIVKKALGIRA